MFETSALLSAASPGANKHSVALIGFFGVLLVALLTQFVALIIDSKKRRHEYLSHLRNQIDLLSQSLAQIDTDLRSMSAPLAGIIVPKETVLQAAHSSLSHRSRVEILLSIYFEELLEEFSAYQVSCGNLELEAIKVSEIQQPAFKGSPLSDRIREFNTSRLKFMSEMKLTLPVYAKYGAFPKPPKWHPKRWL